MMTRMRGVMKRQRIKSIKSAVHQNSDSPDSAACNFLQSMNYAATE